MRKRNHFDLRATRPNNEFFTPRGEIFVTGGWFRFAYSPMMTAIRGVCPMTKATVVLMYLSVFMLTSGASFSRANPCQNLGTSLVVLADSHRLHVCKDNQSIADFRVSLGRGGLGKTA